jgi:hypothetical protein
LKRVSLEKSQLSRQEVAALAQCELLILTRNGKPSEAVKDLAGSDWESLVLVNNLQFVALIEKSRQSYLEESDIGLEQLR